MKKLFTALLLLVGFVSFSQSTGYFRYDSVRLEKVGGNSELILLNSTRDSLGFLYNIGNGRTRFKTLSSLGIASKVSNGVRMRGDTIQLGGTIHRATHLLLENHQMSGSQFSYLHLANRPEAETIIQEDTLHPTVSIYNPTTLAAEALYEESAGDTAYLHYGGRLVSVVRNLFDSTSTRFAATNKSITLPSNGFEGVYQFMIPRDSTVWGVGRDGQSANVIHAQWDLGHFYGYNTNIVPVSGLPAFPLTTVLSSIDLMRNIDNDRRHKMTGTGVTGFMSRYKSYQTAINMSTYEAGNYTDSVYGYKAYGDTYPEISGATKAKTLAVWTVKNAFGFVAEPQYRYKNTVDNGYSFYAKGDTDFLVNRGFAYFGPGASPQRQGNTEGLRYRIYNTGKYWGTDSLHGFIVDGYGMSVNIPIAIGSQAGMNFTQTDSAVVGTIGAYLVPATRAFRGFFIRSEIFNGATMDNNSTGGFVQIETGVNHAFVTRWWRNGGMVVNMVSATTDQYRLYTKFLVNGTSRFLDSIGYINAPAAYDDTMLFKPIWINTTDKKLYQGYHKGSGGGASGLTVGTTTITSGTNTRILYDNSGVLGEYTISGSGNVAMTTSPAFTTPDIGTPSAGTLTNATGYLWNNIANPTGTQTLSFDDGEVNSWTNGSNTETFHSIPSNSLTSGKVLDIPTSSITNGNLLSLSSSSTAANGFSLLNISSSGANANSSRTATGGIISVTNTGTGSTNNGLIITASGGANNYALTATPNILINSPSVDANNALLIQGRTNGNYEGIAMYRNDNVTASFYGTAGITRAGAFTLKTTVSSLSLLGSSGVIVGTEFGSANSTLHVSGSMSVAYVAKTANYTATSSDNVIEVTANSPTITLPTAVGIPGRIYHISNSGAGTVTIGTTSSQTFINFTATPTTLTLAAVGSYSVCSNGANWLVLSK